MQKRKLGILNAGPVVKEIKPIFGSYTQIFSKMLGGFDFSFDGWMVFESQFPDSTRQCDAWLITGSKFGVYENLPWIPHLENFIRECHRSNLPLIGVCFGHQIISQALGGKVEKFEGGWGVGRSSYDFLGRTITLNSWHQDQVVKLPETAKLLGGNSFCKNGFVRHGTNTFSLQPHPEFDHDFIEGLLEYRGNEVPKQQLDGAKLGLGEPLNNHCIQQLFSDHIKTNSLSTALSNFVAP